MKENRQGRQERQEAKIANGGVLLFLQTFSLALLASLAVQKRTLQLS